jgi:hypothetical protein
MFAVKKTSKMAVGTLLALLTKLDTFAEKQGLSPNMKLNSIESFTRKGLTKGWQVMECQRPGSSSKCSRWITRHMLRIRRENTAITII